MEKFGISFNHLPIVTKEKTPVIEHEYQEVCLECEKYFGKSKKIWIQPHRKGVTNTLMRYALKETEKRGIKNILYFIKIINNQINENEGRMEANTKK